MQMRWDPLPGRAAPARGGRPGRPEAGSGPGPRTSLVGRRSLFRSAVSSGVATGTDFVAVLALVSGAGLAPPLATAIGCALGALVNFTVNRLWSFRSPGALLPQAWRYALVSFSSLLLNTGGVAALLLVPRMDYRVAWWLVRIAVFVGWNHPRQRDYVFPHSSSVQPPARRPAGRAES
jgi:putative flippase GtrA